MGAQKVLLDHATINHSVRVLEGNTKSQVFEDFYNLSLNNLIHAIVLYKEIYVLETQVPAHWKESKFSQKIDRIVKPIRVQGINAFDLAETSFAKSVYFVTSPIGCNYVHSVLLNADRQIQRKNISIESEYANAWEKSKIFGQTDISSRRDQIDNLKDIFLAYCRTLFADESLSELKAVEQFKNTYNLSLELAMSLMYWLVYRTQMYHLAAVCLGPRHKRDLACTYFPVPMRAEVLGIDPKVMGIEILTLYQQAIRHYDKEAAEEFRRRTGIDLIITPVPSIFETVVLESASLSEIIDQAIVLRETKQAIKFRDHLANLESKFASGKKLKELTNDLLDLKNIVFSDWGVLDAASQGSSMALSVNPSIEIGNLKLEIGKISFRAVQRFRQKMRLGSLVKMLRSHIEVNNETHRIAKFYDLLPGNVKNELIVEESIRKLKKLRYEQYEIDRVRKQGEIKLTTSSFWGLWGS